MCIISKTVNVNLCSILVLAFLKFITSLITHYNLTMDAENLLRSPQALKRNPMLGIKAHAQGLCCHMYTYTCIAALAPFTLEFYSPDSIYFQSRTEF